MATGKHAEVARLIRESDHLLESTLDMDEEAVAAIIEEAHKEGTAPTFYNNEQALRSVIRLAYISCVDRRAAVRAWIRGRGIFPQEDIFPPPIAD